MSIRIYTMTHKTFDVPPDSMYCPLQVGSALHEDLGYTRDDTGENISAQNGYYSELTGLYWIWKNVTDIDYVGTAHYRRYLMNEKGCIFSKEEYLELLQQYDLITTKRVVLNNSYHFGFAANHNIQALDMTGEVIREMYPAYYPAFEQLVNGTETYFGNLLVTTKARFDAYCAWLFSIFAEVQKRIDMETDKDAYHRRVFGFISEFLLLVWVTVNQLHVLECKVAMIGEKAETREIKEQLAAYIRQHQIEEAKDYFLKQHRVRPDILMEASDITGELHLAMQILATASEEKRRNLPGVLAISDDFAELVPLFAGLNRTVTHYANGQEQKEDRAFLQKSKLSDSAVAIAVAILPNSRMDKQELLQKILADKEQEKWN